MDESAKPKYKPKNVLKCKNCGIEFASASYNLYCGICRNIETQDERELRLKGYFD